MKPADQNPLPSLPVPRDIRVQLAYPEERYNSRGRLVLKTPRDARDLAVRLGRIGGKADSAAAPAAADIYGAAWIVTAWDLMLHYYREGDDPVETGCMQALEEALGKEPVQRRLASVREDFFSRKAGAETAGQELPEEILGTWLQLRLAQENPAFRSFTELFRESAGSEEGGKAADQMLAAAQQPGDVGAQTPADAQTPGAAAAQQPCDAGAQQPGAAAAQTPATGQTPAAAAAQTPAAAAAQTPAAAGAQMPGAAAAQQPGDGQTPGAAAWAVLEKHDSGRPPQEPENAPPLATLRKPVDAAPFSVREQIIYIMTRWGSILGGWAAGLIGALDMIEEETRPRFSGPGPAQKPVFDDLDGEARFSHDLDWMPRVVLIAKNILVWLHQLREQYKRDIWTLNDIPDEELDILASRGFNALWLIGLWERSAASREIKQRMGNPEAAASAYSLYGYTIDPVLGGWDALENLRRRAGARGIRLSSDMVPNHVGLDSDWVRHYPDRLLSSSECPFPAYGFNSDNLSGDPGVDIRIEDHYWNRSDAAVVFRREDRNTGEVRYIYHGNDGTSMPWNDTAQIDFLNPEAREAVIQDILHVARNFPIIRFDAAMVLARKSIRRLWFPSPGSGGAIPSRSEHALSDEEFMSACPSEFWRDVVDRVAAEVPGTLLLAEAFWMMEGYFVRSLGMHRVYNSAFMNMLRDGKNAEYREAIKETLTFDPGILQRYVNFMNNPDEETAVDQFGKDDRYFAACTLLTTLPGLPMFGHGQVEGFTEKYGMEYVRAYREEQPDGDLVARHEREIFPLMHRRSLFAGALSFRLYDLNTPEGVNENVFAYSNTDGQNRVLVLVNNRFERSCGTIHYAFPVNDGNGGQITGSLGDALVPSDRNSSDWVLMREHVSGLWFLRSAGELRSQGLSVALDGYGRQVFLDFRYESERPDGLWGMLAAELNGRGVPDPDEALRLLLLRPVHTALDTILSVQRLEESAVLLLKGEVPVLPNLPEGIRQLMNAHKTLSGRNFKNTPEDIARTISGNLAGAAAFGRRGGSGLVRRLNRLFPEAGESDTQISDARLLVLWSVLAPLLSAEGHGTTAVLREIWKVEHWLSSRGMEQTVGQALLCVKAAGAQEQVLQRRPWRIISSGKLLNSLMFVEDFRTACGVNRWDGILWFEETGWKKSVRSAVLTAGFKKRSPLSCSLRRMFLKKATGKWHRAAARSEYQLDRLLKAVQR